MVRVSGPDALKVVDRVFTAVSGKQAEDTPGYRGLFGRVHDGQGEIDEAVVFVYRAPKSYTGEDVAEICCHGGIYLVQRTLRACLNAGARAAQAGEFTRRAFLNGKMNLTQAEAVADLIAAQGQQSAQAALQARDGAIFRRIHQVVEKLLGVSSALAAWVDYPDEDIDEVSDENLRASVYEICGMLEGILKGYDNGRLLREGISTVIVGRPNVGKSTLMNLLSGEQKSIVTQIPGTTRDIVEDTIRLGEVVLHLADTAGLRDTDDPVERMGVELARKRLNSSYLVLAVFDGSTPLTPADEELMTLCKGKNAVAVVNKNDLPPAAVQEKIRAAFDRVVAYSAKNHTGRDDLAVAVAGALGVQNFDAADPLLANERQRQCCQMAADCVAEAMAALESGMTYDAVNVSIDAAADALLSLTGARATQAVVDRIFEKFCVGK